MGILRQLDIGEKIQLSISYILRASLLFAIVNASLNKNWITLFTALFALLLTFLPSLIERKVNIYLPIEFEFIITAFIYASLFLGEVHNYYTKFWWWDLVLHSTAGIGFGFLGFFIMYILHHEKKITTSPILIALFSCSFAIAIGSIWEIFEFSMDHALSMNLQRSSLIDTMWDMIVNGGGALLTGVLGYFYVKGGDSLVFNRLVTRLIERNPRLFKRYLDAKRNL